MLGVAGIQEERGRRGRGPGRPAARVAYVLRSLKHPAEDELLRSIYGSSFFLIAAYAPIASRRNTLADIIAGSRHGMRREDAQARADALIRRDDHQKGIPEGQRVRDTFPRADVFISTHRPKQAADQVRRFLDLLFGHPYRTPTRDEFAMFQARAAALRSADMSRQVGAAIATDDGDVVALGTNEVPKAGGGAYWEDDPEDGRDFRRGRSESLRIRLMMLSEVVSRMTEEGWLDATRAAGVQSDVDKEVARLLPIVKDSTLMAVGEFGRTVHAEMAALSQAARRGIAVAGCTLFSTTFPCHNCTKHIVVSGLRRVVYIEPFPKSRAAELHEDAVAVDADGASGEKVQFVPFVGVAPRRYLDLFTMPNRERDDGTIVQFIRATALPRTAEASTRGYVDAEDIAMVELRRRLERDAESKPSSSRSRRRS